METRAVKRIRTWNVARDIPGRALEGFLGWFDERARARLGRVGVVP